MIALDPTPLAPFPQPLASWCSRPALVASGWITNSASALAGPTQPSAADRQITLAVSMLMERPAPVRPAGWTTRSRSACLETFIKDLDPLKLFFYQSDVDEFMRNRDQLDDTFKHGDIRFAYDVFARFLARVDERIADGRGRAAASRRISPSTRK